MTSSNDGTSTNPSLATDPLFAIQGIDHGTAMLAALGSVTTYRRLLGMFVDLHGDDPQRLRALVADAAWPTLRQRLHTLKGAAGYLALNEIVSQLQSAEKLAAAGTEPAQIAASVDAVLRGLEPLIASIRQAIVLHDAAAANAG